MSTVADISTTQDLTIATLETEAPAPSRAGRFGWLLGRNAWALADQVLMSGTNFATAALTLRALAMDGEAGKREFGTFSTMYATLLLINILQSTLITQPHNVLGVTREG